MNNKMCLYILCLFLGTTLIGEAPCGFGMLPDNVSLQEFEQALETMEKAGFTRLDFIDIQLWKRFAKEHNITVSPVEFFRHINNSAQDMAHWRMFCWQRFGQYVAPTQHCVQLWVALNQLQDEYNKVKSHGVPSAFITGSGLTAAGCAYLSYKIYHSLPPQTQEVLQESIKRYGKEQIIPLLIPIVERIPNVSEHVAQIAGTKDTQYTIPLTQNHNLRLPSRNQLIHTIIQTASECTAYQLHTIQKQHAHQHNQVTNESNEAVSHYKKLRWAPYYAMRDNEQLLNTQDGALFLAHNLASLLIDTAVDPWIAQLWQQDDPRLLNCKDFLILAKPQLAHICKTTAQRSISYALLSYLSTNKNSTSNTSKMTQLQPADVARLLAVESTAEISYNVLAQVGHDYAPSLFPQSGIPHDVTHALGKMGYKLAFDLYAYEQGSRLALPVTGLLAQLIASVTKKNINADNVTQKYLVDIVTQTLSDAVQHNIKQMVSQEENTPCSKTQSPKKALLACSAKPELKDYAYLLANNTSKKVIDALGTTARTQIPDDALVSIKGRQLLSRHQFMHASELSIKQLVAQSILAQTAINKASQAPLQVADPATAVQLMTINTISEVSYSMISQVGHHLWPHLFSADGTATTEQQATTKAYVQKMVAACAVAPAVHWLSHKAHDALVASIPIPY